MKNKKNFLPEITEENIKEGFSDLCLGWRTAGRSGAPSTFYAKISNWTPEAIKIGLERKWIEKCSLKE